MRLMRQARLSPTFPSAVLSVVYPDGWEGEKSRYDEDTEFVVGKSYSLLTEDEVDLAKENLAGDADALQFTELTLVDPEDPLLTYSRQELDELEKELNFELTTVSPSGGFLPEQNRVIQIRTKGYRGLGLRRLKDRVPPQLLYRSATSMNDFVGEEAQPEPEQLEEQPKEASQEEKPEEKQPEQAPQEEQPVEDSPPAASADTSEEEQPEEDQEETAENC